MGLRDCVCLRCLCYRATRDDSGMCAGCRSGRHPGDPRPADRLMPVARRRWHGQDVAGGLGRRDTLVPEQGFEP
jgi:hypothetical protein